MSFVHLHVHSEYSLLDSTCRLRDLAASVKAKGQNAVAVTDSGNMFAAVDFYVEAKKAEIKPIIGCEIYVKENNETSQIVLLCENMKGYKNLIKMLSDAWISFDGFLPCVTHSMIEQHHEGLICLSGGITGEIPSLVLKDNFEEALRLSEYYKNIFGNDNFFLEIQNHYTDDEKKITEALLKISDSLNIPLVVTNDCHYIDKEDFEVHKIVKCIGNSEKIDSYDPKQFKSSEFYIKSEQEMRELFQKYPQAFDITQKIADRCNVEFEFGKIQLPHFDLPEKTDHFEYFKKQCFEGLYKNYGSNPDDSLIKRLEYELEVVRRMGYVDYYLIVNDFIQYAKSNDIPVGPGRGSGAGSLAAYCIGITGIDPIKYDLLFERFLNPERVSMPDFDIDFCKDRRQEVIDYVVRKYGADHVSQIIAFGTLAARGAVRDVGRVLNMPYALVDSIAKLIPMELGITIDKALSMSSELKRKYDSNENIMKLIDIVRKIEGLPRHATTHAAGVVITQKPVDYYVPLAKNDEAVVTQYNMTRLEQLGLLKMDFLGLRNLTVLHNAKSMIKESHPDFSDEMINYSDKRVFNMISKGYTPGVFQFESSGMTNVIMQLKPVSIEDLIAVISLYRPGPMDSIPTYIRNRHDPSRITYKHPLLKPILEVTYGCIVYQEQVMQIFRILAGYSLGRADIVRRAMSKKKKDVMEKEREIFIHGLVNSDGKIEVDGCVRRGVDEKTAVSVFEEMESFASYAFNKSHAAAYATVSYMTAWYKCHFTREYMAALLSSILDNSTKLPMYISECMRIGIKLFPPDVNRSDYGYTVIDRGISVGLRAVRNVSSHTINVIVEERKKKKFDSFIDFCKRICCREGVNSRGLDCLIRAGALDNLDLNRQQMCASLPGIMESIQREYRQNLSGQMSFFEDDSQSENDSYKIIPIADFTLKQKLALEKEMTGMYFSGHPLDEYRSYINSVKCDKLADIKQNGDYYNNKKVRIITSISKIKNSTTKNNTLMSFVLLEDLSDEIEMLVFSNTLAEYRQHLFEGNIVEISGKVSSSPEDEPKIICDKITAIPRSVIDNSIKADNEKKPKALTQRLYLKLPSQTSTECLYAKKLLAVFEGTSPVSLFFIDTQKYHHLPAQNNVYLNDVLINELKRVLGDDCVVVK